MVLTESTTDNKYEKYLYTDKQSELFSKFGAVVAFKFFRQFRHGQVVLSGLEKLKQSEPNIISPTHQHRADVPIMGWAARQAGLKPPSFIAKVGLFGELPLLAQAMRYAGAYFVRQSLGDLPHLQRHIGDKLAEGRSVVLFPEGKRRGDDEPIELQAGIGVVAVRLAVSINPVGIYFPPKSEMAKNSPVGVVVGEPLMATRPHRLRRELTDALHDYHHQAKELAGY